ncbi:serine protease [Kitasatospora sp. NPDC101183]|uniref:serine protease n=1 Tax=Kitasatospora sp. NPDC101183 TaxID=3364100 RepID=UPI0037FD5164
MKRSRIGALARRVAATGSALAALCALALGSAPQASAIYHGTAASDGQFPYAAFVLADDGANPPHAYRCSGALIGNAWVVTAAHCLTGTAARARVILGAADESGSTGARAISTTRGNWIVHPQYDPATLANDIALIHLPYPVTPDSRTSPVTRSTSTADYANSRIVVAGWGLLDDSTTSPVLHYVQTTVMPVADCSRYYGLTSSMLCMDAHPGGSCQGDSGGPVTIYDVYGKPLLIGIVSFGGGGCANTLPRVATRIGAFDSWIHQQTWT